MRKLSIFLISLCLLVPTLAAAQSRVIECENPKVTVFLPPKGMENGKAVVACPGGGYSHLARDPEGFFWAPFFNHLGYA